MREATSKQTRLRVMYTKQGPKTKQAAPKDLRRRIAVVEELPPAEHGDGAHHLRAADGLGDPALVAPREVRVAAALDLAHARDEAREEGRVERLGERVEPRLVEDVGVARGGRVGPEVGPLLEGARLVVAVP